MGNPLVRFWEGQESTGVWTRSCGTAAKAGGKRRTRTSSCSSGRLLPTRSEAYRARDTKHSAWSCFSALVATRERFIRILVAPALNVPSLI